MSEVYAFILAGGSGTRFWPLSRDKKPKQLLPIFSGKTMLALTLERIKKVCPPKRTYILTNIQQFKLVKKIAQQLPEKNIIAEPARRDTGAAIALAVGIIKSHLENARMMLLPSDQFIKNNEDFEKILHQANQLSNEQEALITIGIEPTWPCSAYGYIELAEQIAPNAFNVKRFREKPNRKLAKKYLKKGNFVWNSGMFFWSIASVMTEFKKNAPQLADFANKIAKNNEKPVFSEQIKEEFLKLKPISIDFALMEKAQKIICLRGNFGWDDVGGWNSLAKYLTKDKNKNSSNNKIYSIDSKKNIIFDNEEKKIALLGVKNLIIVRTKDSLLIAKKNKSEQIKKIVENLPTELR